MNIPGRKYFKDEIVLSDWFPRGGDNAIFRVERIDSTGSVKLMVTFLTKNTEEEGNGEEILDAPLGDGYEITLHPADDGKIRQVFIPSETTPVDDPPLGLKELVRLKFQSIGVGASNKEDWVLARCFPPIFFDDANRPPTRA